MPLPSTYKITLQVNRTDLERLQILAATVLGARQVYEEPGLAAFQLPNGSLLELYGPGASCPRYLFQRSQVVVSFKVPDLAQALQQALAAGLQPVSEFEHVCDVFSFCHLQLTDGNIIGLYQEGTPPLNTSFH